MNLMETNEIAQHDATLANYSVALHCRRMPFEGWLDNKFDRNTIFLRFANQKTK